MTARSTATARFASTSAATLFLCLFAFACDKPIEQHVTVIGPKGGQATGPEGITLEIPEGALSANVSISVTVAEVPSGADVQAVGKTYRFEPEGQTFAKPVTIKLPYDASTLPLEASADDVVILTAPDGSTDFTSLGGRPAGAAHVEAETTHFSLFVSALIKRTTEPLEIVGRWSFGSGTLILTDLQMEYVGKSKGDIVSYDNQDNVLLMKSTGQETVCQEPAGGGTPQCTTRTFELFQKVSWIGPTGTSLQMCVSGAYDTAADAAFAMECDGGWKQLTRVN